MSRPFLEQIDRNIHETDLKEHDKAVFILHDQLNLEAWPEWVQEEKPLLIFMESNEKGNELPHHKVKATYILSCMRHFALECHDEGFPVLYHSTPDHFDDGLSELLQNYDGELIYMTPSEWDTRERLQSLHEEMEDTMNEIPNGFFYCGC